jgi:hypothetical protein
VQAHQPLPRNPLELHPQWHSLVLLAAPQAQPLPQRRPRLQIQLLLITKQEIAGEDINETAAFGQPLFFAGKAAFSRTIKPDHCVQKDKGAANVSLPFLNQLKMIIFS